MIPFPGRQLDPSRQNVRCEFAHRLFDFPIALVRRGDEFPNPWVSASCIYGVKWQDELPTRAARQVVEDGNCVSLRCNSRHVSYGPFWQLVGGTIAAWKGSRRTGISSEDTRDDG